MHAPALLHLPTAALVIALPLASPVLAQADFHESFEYSGPPGPGNLGPPELIAKGWEFRNQSEPLAPAGWFSGPVLSGFVWTFPAQAGEHYLAADFHSTSSFTGGTISDWAILPEVSGQEAGDVISLWTREQAAPLNDTRVEIRYSPTGGTSTGSTASDVGDFTVLLSDVFPLPSQSWGAFSAAVPGTGRLALRFHVPFECGFQTGGCNQQSFIGIDELHVGPPVLPPCNSPPTPIAGQTVVWPLSGSPYKLCGEVVVPQEAEVLIEAGVEVDFDGHSIVVEGRLAGTGTAAQPITLSADVVVPEALQIRGEVDLAFSVLAASTGLSEVGATLILTDSTFDARGSTYLHQMNDALSVYTKVAPVVRFERVHVLDDGLGSAVFLPSVQMAVQDVSTERAYFEAGGYVRIDGAVSHDAPSFGFTFAATDGVYVDRVTVRDAGGAGLLLGGYASQLGPDVTIEGCDYPLAASGLRPESTLPLSGNDTNAILASGGGYWANLGLPWLATINLAGMAIEPGVEVFADPNVSLSPRRLLGTPEEPIRLGASDPAQPWRGLIMTANSIDRVIVEDAINGVLSQQSQLWVWNSTFRNCDFGLIAAQYGLVVGRSVIAEGNVTGLKSTDFGNAYFSSPENPSVLAGNAAGMQADDDAFDEMEYVWWGDASGPQHPSNPTGSGDAVVGTGASDVDVLPFATAPPLPDDPPVVRLRGHQETGQVHAVTLDPGDTIFLEWDASDDSAITEQRVLYSFAGAVPSNYAVLDVLPAGQRAYAYTAPDVGQYNLSPHLRIEAVDDAGQLGSDGLWLSILNNADEPTEGIPSPDFAGQTLSPGDRITIPSWMYTTPGIIEGDPTVWVEVDSTDTLYLGGYVPGLWMDLPFVSTDRARIAIDKTTTTNTQKWMYGDYFSIRPDALIGDAPPNVTLLAPQSGQSFQAGTTVSIQWTASDDEALRSINLQASTDGGKRWRTIAYDLAPTATEFDWQLPPDVVLNDVRLRVIAFDLRHQNSASDLAPGIDITAGGFLHCQEDLGFGGPGSLDLSLCGDVLDGSGSADLSVDGAPPNAPLWILLSGGFQPTGVLGGTLVTWPSPLILQVQTDALGAFDLPGIGSIGTASTVYMQAVAVDLGQLQGFAISNALEVQFLP